MTKQQDLLDAKETLLVILGQLGEDDFAELVEDIANERLKTAVGRLFSSQWWSETLKLAIANPAAATINTQLFCKLLDKAVPTQQAVKIGADEGFRLLIERVEPQKEP